MISYEEILSVLDQCCSSYTFPALDNGYVYLAATRLTLYRSVSDWALVIEVFGYSPRGALPDTRIHTYASRLHERDSPSRYVNRRAYELYLANHPNNEFRFVCPISEGPWQGEGENCEFVADDAEEVTVRHQAISLPTLETYPRHGIYLEEPPRAQVFELCRYLADIAREQVLATPEERRVSVLPAMRQILQLEEWHHPDLCGGEQASQTETFRQLAQVLSSGDITFYQPSEPPNTHWRNWPESGRL